MYTLIKQSIYTLLIIISVTTHIAWAEDKDIVIGSKNFTEQYVLSEIAKQLLEQDGFNVNVVSNLPTLILRSALENNEVDLYFEYTGTTYSVIYNAEASDIVYDSERLYDWVKREDAKKNLEWLQPIPFNNTYAFITSKETAEDNNIYSISDLKEYMRTAENPLMLGAFLEVWERDDGAKQVEKTYDIEFPLNYLRKMDQGLIYLALLQNYIDIGIGTATDGFILAYSFVVLEDDQHAFPVYNPAPVVRKPVLEEYPEIEPILNQLSDCIDTDTMRYLNAQLQVEHRPVEMVVREWLQDQQCIV